MENYTKHSMKSIIIDVKKIVTLAEIGLGAERPLNKEKRYWIKKLSKQKNQKPILVSQIKDSNYYILCDGWHRLQAVLKQKKRGQIEGTFELKNSPGISYWGYKNLVDFIRFTDKPKEEKNIHIRFSSLIRTINPSDEQKIFRVGNKSIPEQFHKFSLIKNEKY